MATRHVLAFTAILTAACARSQPVDLPDVVSPFRPSTIEHAPVPRTLDEALDVLDHASSGQVYLHVWHGDEPAVNDLHESLGRWIRNNWGLNRRDSLLFQELSRLGLMYSEDMSYVIFRSWWRRMHRRPVDTEGQVGPIREFNEQMRRRALESLQQHPPP